MADGDSQRHKLRQQHTAELDAAQQDADAARKQTADAHRALDDAREQWATQRRELQRAVEEAQDDGGTAARRAQSLAADNDQLRASLDAANARCSSAEDEVHSLQVQASQLKARPTVEQLDAAVARVRVWPFCFAGWECSFFQDVFLIFLWVAVASRRCLLPNPRPPPKPRGMSRSWNAPKPASTTLKPSSRSA